MNILIFGATGSIGQQAMMQALDAGHRVTAFARKPASIEMQHERLTVVQGDVMEASTVVQAMPEHDAVVVALGAGAKGEIRAQGTRNVIQAMQQTGVNRIVCLSSLGAGDSQGNLNFLWKYIVFAIFLRRALADHNQQESYLRSSGLDWTIVRPGGFTDGELTKAYQHGFSTAAKHLKLKVSRADVAHFMLAQLDSAQYLGKSPGISY